MLGDAASTMDRHGEQMRRMMNLGLFLFLGLLISGCGGSSTSRVCNTGDQLPCLCLGGGTGVQVCLVDGSGYGSECIGCTSGAGGGGGGSAGGGGGSAGGGGGSAGGGGGGSATCPAGWTLCGTACVDPTSNPMHCGTCANACPSGQVCQNSACRGWADCQQNPCPGLSYCDLGSGTCKAGCLTDSQCTTDETCSSHDCACKTGFHRCGGVCVSNDVEHCGPSCSVCPTDPHGTATCDGTSCGITCSAGAKFCGGACAVCPSGSSTMTCSGSACVASTCGQGYLLCGGMCAQCPTPGTGAVTSCSGSSCILTCATSTNTLCGSGCYNTNSDASHCGGCGGVCPGGTQPNICCSGTCINPYTDVNNCGSCGHACSSECSGGGCCIAYFDSCQAFSVPCCNSKQCTYSDQYSCTVCQ